MRCGRWAAAAGVALALGAGAGCATEADPAALDEVVAEGRATGEAGFLAAAGEQSSAEAYRVSMRMSMSMSGIEDDAGHSFGFEGEVLTGAQDGDAYQAHLDMTGVMAEAGLVEGEQVPPGALSLDMVGDRTTVYLRAPTLSEFAAGTDDEGADELRSVLGGLGDRWGRVDLTAIEGLTPADVPGSMVGPGTSDPAEMLDMLSQASDTEDLGTDEIDGVEVHGTGFVVSFADMFGNVGGAGAPADDEPMAATADALLGDVPFEAWVDGDGYVRRLSYEVDMGEALAGVDEPTGAGDLPEGFSVVMGATIDFSDYGDPGIEVVFPDDADTVDVTAAYRRLMEGD